MISILLDTSTKYVTFCVLKDNEIIYNFHEKLFEDLSVEILPLIEKALEKCCITSTDIKKIYVAVGPGSFTGIRIGLTIMKVMAWTLNIDIVPISSLELLASTKTYTDYIVPYIDARRGNCFISVYDNELNNICEDQFANFETFIKNIDKDKTFKIVTYDQIDYENKLLPEIDVIKVINKHKYDKPVNPHSINPNYLKLTEAEENLKNKND